MGSSDKEEIDSDVDTVLTDIANWSDPLRPIKITEFTGPTTVMEKNKWEIYFFNLLFPEALSIEIATLTNEYARKHIEATPFLFFCIDLHCLEHHFYNKNWYPTNPEEIKALIGIQIVLGVIQPPAQDMYWYKDKLVHQSIIEMKFSPTRYENLMKYFHVPDTSRNFVNIT